MFHVKHWDFDVVVIGGGHAGADAAHAAARLGANTALITHSFAKIGEMSCNPAIGGLGKGHLVREIDALGGLMGKVADRAGIQFRLLNRRKGPAVQGPRAQADRALYRQAMQAEMKLQPNLTVIEAEVSDLRISANKVAGMILADGSTVSSQRVVLTTGTFLRGVIHIGDESRPGGRMGDKPSIPLAERIDALGLPLGRLKTGTPPRLDGRTINWDSLESQPGDDDPVMFSFLSNKPFVRQVSCGITHTNQQTHEIIEQNLSKSAIYGGHIEGVGPRYCPSIEDKINRFSEKDRHQIFVEPEGWSTVEVYVNGFSTSLPEDVQFKALSSVKGFERVKFFRPGYAIEYDYFPPTQLKNSLETKPISGLFFAGQINGTTGYEEAAAQGLMAGLNAHLKTKEKEPLVLKRDEAYIGVLIDDLITKGTDEPYRMFTSRAEYRTLLRQDNADLRLTPLSHALGLASKERLNKVENKKSETDSFVSFFRKTSVRPEEINPILVEKKSSEIKQSTKLFKVFSRPNISLKDLMKVESVKEYFEKNKLDKGVCEQTEVQVKYSGYIEKERLNAEKLNHLENIKIPSSFMYSKVKSLSAEATQKLDKIKPTTLAQAARVSGVSPNDISVLMVYIGR